MKKYLPKLVFAVAVLLTISIVFLSCQRKDPTDILNSAMKALNDKNYNEAIEYFNKAIEMYPYFAEPYFFRATTYFRMKNYEEAIADFTRCVKYDPSHAEAYYWRGEVYYHLEDYSNAISNYTKAIELDPDNIYYYYSRGTTYYLRDRDDDFKKSIDDYRKGCELGDNDSCKALKDLLDLR